MLAALADVPGYDDFAEFLVRRATLNSDWKAEVKGLFEIHKPQHPLVQIQSHKQGSPEAQFRVGTGIGIVECAFIRYRFDTNQATLRALNRLTQFLAGQALGTTVSDPTPRLSVTKKEGGTSATDYNVDIVRKLKQVIEEKRKQHKKLAGAHALCVYYFYIDSPPPALARAADTCIDRISGILKPEEIAIACAVGVSKGRWGEKKISVWARGAAPPPLDFSNPFLDS